MEGRLPLARLVLVVIHSDMYPSANDASKTLPCQVFLVIKMIVNSVRQADANDIQPSGHFKVLRLDQDLQDVRGGEVSGAMLPHLQEPLVTSQARTSPIPKKYQFGRSGSQRPPKKNPYQ